MLDLGTVSLLGELAAAVIVHCVGQAGLAQLFGWRRVRGGVLLAVSFGLGVGASLITAGVIVNSQLSREVPAVLQQQVLLLIWYVVVNCLAGWGVALIKYQQMRFLRELKE